MSAWDKANPEKRREIGRRSHLKRTYGITLDEYDAMLDAQLGRCAICGSDSPGTQRNEHFAVDHDHASGKVRGLLCTPCNALVGNCHESIDVLASAIRYIARYQ